MRRRNVWRASLQKPAPVMFNRALGCEDAKATDRLVRKEQTDSGWPSSTPTDSWDGTKFSRQWLVHEAEGLCLLVKCVSDFWLIQDFSATVTSDNFQKRSRIYKVFPVNISLPQLSSQRGKGINDLISPWAKSWQGKAEEFFNVLSRSNLKTSMNC